MHEEEKKEQNDVNKKIYKASESIKYTNTLPYDSYFCWKITTVNIYTVLENLVTLYLEMSGLKSFIYSVKNIIHVITCFLCNTEALREYFYKYAYTSTNVKVTHAHDGPCIPDQSNTYCVYCNAFANKFATKSAHITQQFSNIILQIILTLNLTDNDITDIYRYRQTLS